MNDEPNETRYTVRYPAFYQPTKEKDSIPIYQLVRFKSLEEAVDFIENYLNNDGNITIELD